MRKGFTFALIALALIIAGCQGQTQTTTEDNSQTKGGDWTAFQQLFKEGSLPFSCAAPGDNTDQIPTLEFKDILNPLLPTNFDPITTEAIHAVYPLGKVSIGSDNWLLILYLSEELENYRVAATFTKNGNLISSKLVSQERPCVSASLKIPSGTCIIEEGEEIQGCMDPADEEKTVAFTNHFTITPEGKITQSTTPCNK